MNATVQTTPTIGTAEHPAERIFIDRRSPRGFSDQSISEAGLLTFFEAARWTPSAFNSQPWRFLCSLRGQPMFDAVGRKGDDAHRPAALLQREQPSARTPLGGFVERGLFPKRFAEGL